MTRRLRFATLAILLGLLPAFVRADEPSFATVEAAAERLDFVAVLDAAETAFMSGTLGPGELVRLHQLVAMADTFGGNVAGARSAYVRMLAIDPEAVPDPSVPPRLRQTFDDAARERDRVRVRGTATVNRDAIEVDVDDTLGVVTQVVVFYSLGDSTVPIELSRRAGPQTPIRLPITERTTIHYRVELRDRFGNRWVEIGRPDSLFEAELEPAPTPREERRRRLVRSPWLWIGVGLVAVGAGVGVGLGVAHETPVNARTSVSF